MLERIRTILGLLDPRDTEIGRVRAALRRHEKVVDDMADTWARNNMPCCPGCAFGFEYTEATEQCIRTRRWLVVLLGKRGRPEDLDEIRRLNVDGL